MNTASYESPDQITDVPSKGSAAEPSGPAGGNPSTAGPGSTFVKSSTPENREGKINPSAPNDVNRTPEVPDGKNQPPL